MKMQINFIVIVIIMILACSNNGDSWVKRLSSGDCYECSCEGSTVRCSSAIFCASGCPGISVPLPGKCCPKCVASEYQSTTIIIANGPATSM